MRFGVLPFYLELIERHAGGVRGGHEDGNREGDQGDRNGLGNTPEHRDTLERIRATHTL